jgi:alkylation response protein AidB-like acyl-CoA dehydrogenase
VESPPDVRAREGVAEPHRHARFPLRTTAVMVVLTFGLLALAAGHTWTSYQSRRGELQREFLLHERVQTILSDRPTLTLLARAAVETGNAELRERYARLAQGFEAALRDLRALAADGEMPQVAFRMAETNGSLGAVEARAFELSSAGQVDAARTLLRHTVAGLLDKASRGEVFSEVERTRNQRDRAFVVRLCIEAVNRLFNVSGGHALFLHQPLQRFHRDAQAMSHRASLTLESVAPAYARAALGLSPSTR